MRRRFLLIHNPTAGRAGTALLDAVISVLESRGAVVDAAPSAPWNAGQAALRALPPGAWDALLAAGGDGTIRALAETSATHRLPIGIVPAGTGNVFAEEIGLPRSASGIADVLMHGPAIDLEGATANGTPFFLMAGVGFDGDVVRRVDTRLKRLLGKSAYAAPVIGALLAEPRELSVTIDGTRHSARWVVAARARRYGGRFVIADADLAQADLHVVLFKSLGRWTSLRQLLALAVGRHGKDKDVAVVRGRHVLVEAATPVPAQIDGDSFGTTPLAIEAGGPRIKMIVPARYAGRLRPL